MMAEISVDELIESLNEFTKEENIDLDSIKPQISKLLKTHRPIKLTEYEYGVSSKLSKTKDSRLIIREKDDRSKVRQYLKHQNHHNFYWNCSNRKNSNKCIAKPLKIKYGIVFAPKNHTKECETKEYKLAMEDQEKKGKTGQVNNASSQSLSTSDLNESTLSTTDFENESNLEANDTIVNIDSKNLLSSPPTSSLAENGPTNNLSTINMNSSFNSDLPISNNAISTANTNITSTSQTNIPISDENVSPSVRTSVKRELDDHCLLKEGEFKEEKGFTISKKRLLNTSNQSLSSSILNENVMENESILDLINETSDNADSNILSLESSQTPFPVLTENEKESGRSSVKTEIDNNNYGETEFESLAENSAVNIDSNITTTSSSPALTKKMSKSGRTTVKRELDDEEYCIIIDEPCAKKPKLESKIAENFPFELPSNSSLKKACEKLKIEYSRRVYKFWGDIVFENIVAVSKNIKTHSFQSPNLFACLSLCFTGNVDACFDIQKAINGAFRDELSAAGKVNAAEIEKIYTSNTVSEQHLEFITKFLSCKIGIYENETLKKYGNWENQNDSDVLTLILSLENGLFSVVLDL